MNKIKLLILLLFILPVISVAAPVFPVSIHHTWGLDTLKPYLYVFKDNITGKMVVYYIKGGNYVPPDNENAPVVNVGDDHTYAADIGSVTLDGSSSYSPNGSTLTYLWTQTSGPDITITDATSATATASGFTAGETYKLKLTVTDANDLSSSKTLTVTIEDLTSIQYYAGDSASFNFTPSAQDITGWTDVTGDPHADVISATASNGWGINTVSTSVWKAEDGTSSNMTGETDPLINDFGGFYDGDSAMVGSVFVTPNTAFNSITGNWNLELTGLNPDHKYMIQMIGSKKVAPGGQAYRQDYYVQYSNGGNTSNMLRELNAFNNTSWFAQFDTVQPASDGTIKAFVGGWDSTTTSWNEGVISGLRIWDVSKTETSTHIVTIQHFKTDSIITLSTGGGDSVKALVYLPQYSYNPNTTYATIFYISGNESSGEDPGIIRQYGLPRLIERGSDLYGLKSNGDTVRFIVVCPQFPVGNFAFTSDQSHDMLEDWDANWASVFNASTTNVYATGFSSGGANVVRWMYQYPTDLKAGVAISPVTSMLTDAQIGSLAHVFKDNNEYIAILTHDDQSLTLSKELYDSLYTYSPGNILADQWYGRNHDGFNYQFDTTYKIPVASQTVYDFLVNPTKNIKKSARFSFTTADASSLWHDPFTTDFKGDPAGGTINVTDAASGINLKVYGARWAGSQDNTGPDLDEKGSDFGNYTTQSLFYTSGGDYATNGDNIEISGLDANTNYTIIMYGGTGTGYTPLRWSKFGINGDTWKNISCSGNLRNYAFFNVESDGSGKIDCYVYAASDVDGAAQYGIINGLIIAKE